jgi:hypothetical protein
LQGALHVSNIPTLPNNQASIASAAPPASSAGVAAAPMSDELAGRRPLNGNAAAEVIDPRLALLLWAGVKWDLVEAGFEDLDRAFEEIERAIHIMSPCHCEREMLDRFERCDRELRQQRCRGRR